MINRKQKPNVSGGKFSVSFTIPSEVKAKLRQSESEYGIQKTVLHSLSLQLKQIFAVGPTPGDDPNIPTSNNPINGCTFVDNKDGTATISSTLTAEIEGDINYLLTLGYDEDYYDPTLNPELTDEERQAFLDGTAPINSHKFKFSEFGIEDITNVKFQSFNYIIESDTDLKQFMYGGGINVRQGSPC